MNICAKFLRLKCKQFLIIVFGALILYFCGVFTLFFQTNYSDYVAQVDRQIPIYVNRWLNKQVPSEVWFNNYKYKYIHNCKTKCDIEDGTLRVVYIVKSATRHFQRREGIRRSWGFEKRFSDVEIRTVFMLGVDKKEDIQDKINEESESKGDIIQANFLDSYYNNTIKTMMSLKWAVKYCQDAKFYFFSDDDMYVSTKNVLRFIRNPLEYPDYLEVPVQSIVQNVSQGKQNPESLKLGLAMDIQLRDDNELYGGYVFRNSRPMRHIFSKWYVPLSEYPYDFWPPYVTAGAYVISNRALNKLYYASMYVEHFRFDDIYLSMLALAVNIVPVHNNEFYFEKKKYNIHNYKYVIASHGYENPQELSRVWEEQKSYGNA